MKKKLLGLAVLALGTILCATACSKSSDDNTSANGSNTLTTVTPSKTAEDAEDHKVVITGEFTLTNDTTGAAVSGTDGVYTITEAGEYTATGLLSEGSIIINAPEAEVTLNLSGASITSSVNAPIYCIDAEGLDISAKADTYNEITDNRTTNTDSGNGAIHAKCDLKIKGNGYLVVNGNYNNGVQSSDDLKVKNVTMKITAYNNSLKGNDSVTIESGNLVLISSNGDGIQTEASDISSKGNQRGTVTISGEAAVDIYSKEDGIDAAYDVDIEADTDGASPTVNIYTDSNSKYSGTISSSGDTSTYKRYMRMSSSLYNTYKNYVFAAYVSDNSGNSKWVTLAYSGTQTVSSSNNNMGPGGSQTTTYYVYDFSFDSTYTNIQLYMFSSGTAESAYSTTSYLATDGGGTVNQSKDMYSVTRIQASSSASKIQGDWTSSTSSSSGSDYSTKGIKADNSITISDGAITIMADDDGIHANSDNLLETGSYGTGAVTISGGTISLSSGDDGIHADSTLAVNGGVINIASAYEGYEGDTINITGGTSTVYGTDDGVNASTLINVTGGTLDVTVSSGDTDGIDSNGSYSQSGGFVITRNPTTDTSGNMGAIDVDESGTIKITGGTFIAMGPVSKTPSLGSSVSYKDYGGLCSGGMGGSMGGPGGRGGSSSSSYSFTSGTYTISGTDISFVTTTTYYGFYIASEKLTSGQALELNGKDTSYSW